MQFLAFAVEGVRYAIALNSVQEIVRAVWVTPLPDAPPVISGVFGYRGAAVPLFDLRLRFSSIKSDVHPRERFVIARTPRRSVALRVAQVDGIREIGADQIQDVKDLAPGSSHLTGVTRLSDELLFIHDLERFLSAAEEHDLEESLARLANGDVR